VGISNVQTITSYPNPSQVTSQNHFYTSQRPKTTFSSETSQDFKKPVPGQKSEYELLSIVPSIQAQDKGRIIYRWPGSKVELLYLFLRLME
ncbi:hypothetical protein ABF86_11040, partial [Nitrosomonas sp. GH22]